MDQWYESLHSEGLLSDASYEKIKLHEKAGLFSVHWEIKTLLYIGVLLLTAGLGILVYKNIDTIGHQFVLAFIALLVIGSFSYCFKYALPYDRAKVKAPNTAFDYVLLLGTISFLTFTAYLQYQYQVFGSNYGLATFIPMVLLFLTAYYFDHLGVLSMAIANLALWMGVSVTPKELLHNYDFDSEHIIYTYLLLGILLLVLAFVSQKFDLKAHFKFSYQHYGLHVSFISLLAGYFHFYNSIFAMFWILGLAGLALIFYADAYRSRSFYFLLLVILYSYIALSSLAIRMVTQVENVGGLYLAFLYFLGSGGGLILLLINLNRKLKSE